MTDAAEPDEDNYRPERLSALANELDRISPRLGPIMGERLLRGQGTYCFSFRQLTMFLGAATLRTARDSGRELPASWLPAPVIQMMDEAIFLPLMRTEPPISARSPEQFLGLIADWLRGAADVLSADASGGPEAEQRATVWLDDVEVDRATLVGLIARLAIGQVLHVGKAVRETVLVRRLAILADMPHFSEPPRKRRSRNVAHQRSRPRERR